MRPRSSKLMQNRLANRRLARNELYFQAVGHLQLSQCFAWIGWSRFPGQPIAAPLEAPHVIAHRFVTGEFLGQIAGRIYFVQRIILKPELGLSVNAVLVMVGHQ
jgi:hypothetical protein